MSIKVNWSPETLAELEKRWLIPMLFMVADEDLRKLKKDFPNGEDQAKVLLVMAVEPKDRWKELGVPEYMMKYEIELEDEEE